MSEAVVGEYGVTGEQNWVGVAETNPCFRERRWQVEELYSETCSNSHRLKSEVGRSYNNVQNGS